MKNLNERRDELSEKYETEVLELNPGGFTVADYVNSDVLSSAFSLGFDAAVAELMPEIEKLVKALEFYASEESYESTGTGLALHWVDRIKEDQTRIAQEFGKPKMLGGKRAREALTKFNLTEEILALQLEREKKKTEPSAPSGKC